MDERIYAAIDATWAPLERRGAGAWMLRRGAGGGQRVSAATALRPLTDAAAEIGQAEAEMRAMEQVPLFMIRAGEDALDAALAARGYAAKDPVAVLASAPEALADADGERAMFFEGDGRLAIQEEIWAGAGLGPERLAVMDRVVCPKRYLLGRVQDAPAAAAFMAVADGVAMLHALEVKPAYRGAGLGRRMMQGAARVAAEMGAELITTLVVRGNGPASALYSGLGMREVAGYHYRRFPD